MKLLYVIAFIVLVVVYFRAVWGGEDKEEEEPPPYTFALHELIVSLAQTDAEIQLIDDMLINLSTADAPVNGDVLRSMEISWDWGGKLEQITTFPVGKGSPTNEAMRNLAEVRREELVKKLYYIMSYLPCPEKAEEAPDVVIQTSYEREREEGGECSTERQEKSHAITAERLSETI